MQSDPRVFYALAGVTALIAVLVGVLPEPSFLSGIGVGAAAVLALVFLVVGLVNRHLQSQADELSARIEEALGGGNLDLGALMGGFGLGGTSAVVVDEEIVIDEEPARSDEQKP